jgi:membrane protease YdiL (CAAX protease family)
MELRQEGQTGVLGRKEDQKMNVLKKLYEKSEIWFAVAWIIAYCVLMSLGDSISEQIGINKSVTLVVGILLSAILLVFLKKNRLWQQYGFCIPQVRAKSMLYYLPIVVMLSANLWHGVTLNDGVPETVLYIVSMLCVGFLEEVIFRGFLFEAMKKESVTAAIIVSSVTFGIGHIINLINGSGAQLLPNLLQVVYATAAGFMFVMMYYRSKSLLACIAAHGIFNAISVFANEADTTDEARIVTAMLLTLITGSYALYLALAMKGKENN